MKSIDTLVKDIYDVIEGKGGWDETITDFFSSGMGDVARSRLEAEREERKGTLRLSGMGNPCPRKIWYEVNEPNEGEVVPPSALLKFLYGDILEHLLISLAIAAGHRVEGCQDELYVHGVKGHRDCVIDGITVDIKSASPYSFKKFEAGGLRDDDPFGYVSQLSSYVYAGREHEVESHPSVGAFLVVDKVHGKICLDMYDFSLELKTKEEDFETIKAMVKQDEPPPQGFDPVPEGKSGNEKLGINCSYCSRKASCWPELRTFVSSRGPLYLVTTKREPRMKEIK